MFLLYPALTVMVFLRRDLGYRIVNPKWLFGIALVEIVISLILHTPGRLNVLFLFAVASLTCGLIQRFKRWREVNRGIKQHSFYIGTSCFERAALPMFLRRNRRIARTLDPIVCVLSGLYLWQFSPAFGFWIFFAGICLAGVEGEVHRKERNQTLDMVDSIIASETQSEVVQSFEDAPTARQQEPTSGIPAGLGDDIHNNLKRRKTKQPPPLK